MCLSKWVHRNLVPTDDKLKIELGDRYTDINGAMKDVAQQLTARGKTCVIKPNNVLEIDGVEYSISLDTPLPRCRVWAFSPQIVTLTKIAE